MTTYTLPYFGEIDLKSLDEYYEVKIAIQGKTIKIDINFEEETISKKDIDITKSILERLDDFYKVAQTAIINDFGKGGEVDEYIEYIEEYISDEELAPYLKEVDKNLDKKNQILSIIYLKRVGLYPDDDNNVVLDFTISSDLLHYVLVINMNAKCEIENMCMES